MIANAIFAVGILVNLALLALFHWPARKALVGDERFYVPRMRAYAAGDPVAWDPLWPPFYIDAMGSFARLAGGWHPALVQGTQLVLFLAAAWLFWRIARRLLPGGPGALVALGFFLLMPDLAAYTGFLLAEVLHLFLAVCAFWLVLLHGERLAACAGAGVLLGLALATKLLLLPFLPVILLATAWRHRGTIARRALAAAVLGAALGLTVLPFMVRNQRLHGVFTIGDSSVLNRLITLRDRAPRDWQGRATIRRTLDEFLASAPTFEERNAIARAQIARELQVRGTVRTYLELAPKQYLRLLHHDTHFTTQLPGGPRKGFALRSRTVGSAIRWWAHAAYAALLVLACVGAASVRWRRPGGLHVAALFVIYNLAAFLLLITQTRYMVAIYPALMLFAGLGVHALWRWREVEAARLTVGLVAAAALLALAFPELWGG